MDCLSAEANQIRVVQKPRHPLAFVSVRQDPCAMAASITQAEYDSLISRLAAVEEENAATLLEVDT